MLPSKQWHQSPTCLAVDAGASLRAVAPAAAVVAGLAGAAVEAEDARVVTVLRVANACDAVARVARPVADIVVALALKLYSKQQTLNYVSPTLKITVRNSVT